MKILTKTDGTVVIHKLIKSDDLTIALLYLAKVKDVRDESINGERNSTYSRTHE